MSFMAKVKVAPSILACDFGHLADEVKKVEKAGADAIHIDIMDGHFVPNLTMGPKIVAAINRNTDLFLDVHLMIYNPFEYVERFIEMGADMITFHFEATEDIEETLNYIRKCGKKAGLAFNPETSATFATKFLDKCDMILFMAVNPGFSGQKFMPKVLEKVKLIRDLCDKLNIREGGVVEKKLPPFEIQVDGGINLETAKLCIKAGANFLVSGNYLFNMVDMKEGIESLKKSGIK